MRGLPFLSGTLGSARFEPGGSTVHQIGLSCNPIPPDGYGGIESIVTSLVRGLDERGIETICYSPGEYGLSVGSHVQTLRTPSGGTRENGEDASVNAPAHLETIARRLEGLYEPGDVVHLHHSEQYPELRSTLTSLNPFRGTNVVETVHCNHAAFRGNRVYVSESLRDFFEVPGSVIYPGIDVERFDRTSDPDDDFLLYVGRVTESKGISRGIPVARALGVDFHVVGPIVDREYAASLDGDVVFHGEVDDDELVELYQDALALAYFTRYREPFGLAPVEAMACGTPVLTSGRGGTGETVVDGETGIVADDPDEHLRRLGELDEIRPGDCRERAKTFSNARMVDRYVDEYDRLFG